MKKILIVGAVGQIGSELTMSLRKIYGNDNVVASTRKTPPSDTVKESGPFEFFNVNDREKLFEICKKYEIDAIVNMAAILSAVGEQNPMLAWDVNMNGLINVLEVAREMNMSQVLVPSSIAVFGPETPIDNTPQETILRPTTMYGVTKVAGELLADYYVRKYGLDVRGLRYPGIISNETLPGGGMSSVRFICGAQDYHKELEKKVADFFGTEDTILYAACFDANGGVFSPILVNAAIALSRCSFV